MPLRNKAPRWYYGWTVVSIVFFVLLVSAGISSIPSVLMLQFEKEFGWSRSAVSGALSIRIFLYGLMGPFSAALMTRFGVRRIMLLTLGLLAGSLALTSFMTELWQFIALWGVVIGLATGALANVLGVTVAGRWFVKHRGLVVGILTASAATGQLLFLP
ncbi:MFS transporter, partial [Paenibacillus durus]